MKYCFIAMVALLCISGALAAEKKAIKDVDPDSFTGDTQVSIKGAGDNHMALAWWIPIEFWDSVLSRDPTISESEKNGMLDALKGVTLMGIVQADISAFGAFKFYTKEDVETNMNLTFIDSKDKKHRLYPEKNIDSELKLVIDIFKPVLTNAMGNMGNNLHFFVLDDKSESSRKLDPYSQGLIKIQLKTSDNVLISGDIELPVNALYVPRQCPNGKNAHITWNYCPWSGKQL